MKCAERADVAAEEAAGVFDRSKQYKEVSNMARGDGTGPQGTGPKTGRGQGTCGSSGKGRGAGQGEGVGQRQGKGKGMGRGSRKGSGQGRGSGRN